MSFKVSIILTVGSSSSNRSGSINNARARAIRIRHPPEKVFVALCCISGEKLRPWKMFEETEGHNHHDEHVLTQIE